MAEYIECRNCDSPYCEGCNIHTLATMLHNGKFDYLMGDDHSINPAADVVEVVRCKDCKYYRKSVGWCALDTTDTDYDWHENDFCSHGERRSE